MSLRIAFRVDASAQIGTGHFMRCLTLAGKLRQHGAHIHFISRNMPEHARAMLAAKGYEFALLKDDQNDKQKGGLAHAHWLGTSQAQDAMDTIQAMSGRAWDWLVVDHYALDAEWESIMRPYCNHIMVIDDLADRNHDCDLLLDQNYYRNQEQRYQGLVPEHCATLLGPAHALLRPEFIEAKHRLRVRDGTVKRILVFFGGSDIVNQTQNVVQAIKHLDRLDIKVDVVVGTDNPHRDTIRALCDGQQNVTFSCQVSNMAERIQNADLAIGAGGVAMWERCFLGLPAITVIIAANQERTVEDTASIGAIENLGWYDQLCPEDYTRAIAGMIENPQKARQISESALSAMQAKGGTSTMDVLGSMVQESELLNSTSLAISQ